MSSIIRLKCTPLANELVASSIEANVQDKFPLEVFCCNVCKHIQLLHVVSPERLFREYVYLSGTSSVFVRHFYQYAEFIFNEFCIDPAKAKIFEIGSNDGTLLKAFQAKGATVLGVDPAHEIAAQARQEGIDTLSDFFDFGLSEKIKNDRGFFDVIIANNVFAHIDNLDDTISAVRSLLDDNGIFCIEVSYFLDVYNKKLFDTIYHEHLSYHTLYSLNKFFRLHGMQIIDVISVNTHGGSIRVISQKIGAKRNVKQSVKEFLCLEESSGILDISTLKCFSKKISENGRELRFLLDKKVMEKKKIIGFGLPAKATTLMYHYELGQNYFDYIVDENPLKQGKFSPGKGIEIRQASIIQEEPPDVIVILAWNFSASILRKLQNFIGQGGEVIVPLPEIKLYGGV